MRGQDKLLRTVCTLQLISTAYLHRQVLLKMYHDSWRILYLPAEILGQQVTVQQDSVSITHEKTARRMIAPPRPTSS